MPGIKVYVCKSCKERTYQPIDDDKGLESCPVCGSQIWKNWRNDYPDVFQPIHEDQYYSHWADITWRV